MKIRVRVFGDLTTLLSNEITVELEDGSRLKDLVSKLTERIGSSKKDFLEDYEVKGQGMLILLNGRNIHALKNLETILRDGDYVAFLPPVVGG